MGAAGRFIPDYLIELKFFDRSRLGLRRKITRGYVAALPIASFLIYVASPSFVFLIMVGGMTSALLLPMQSGVTMWLHAKRLDPRIRPRTPARVLLMLVFCFQLLMAGFVMWFVILAPRLG